MSTRILITSLLLAASPLGQYTAKAPATAHYPILIRADLPLYPPVARTAPVNGTVEIQVTVARGVVVDAQVKSSSSPLLSTPAIANVKTWQFQSEDRTTFPVTYVYQIEGDGPNPKRKVRDSSPLISQRDSKALERITNYCAQQNGSQCLPV